MKEIKIFSGSEIEAMALEAKLKDKGVEPIKRNGFESARLAGFGNTDAAVELYVLEQDYEKIKDILN
ncbi:putative signal transducing protein [Flavobacterium sp.]|uniref:putative signal transducing protein n=1 Tax=Flavobacterium sp. TaxID=239 RepID=UPI0035299C7B